GDAGRDDLAGVVELEHVAGAEVAGQAPESDPEALRPVDEAGDALAGARGVTLSEGSGDLSQLLDRVGYVQAEAVQPVLPDQDAITGQRLLERHAVQVPIDTSSVERLLFDL